jgi:formylglycine-generating enzyme required for sulfatase activity
LNCGKIVPEKAKFCPYCGENIQLGEAEVKVALEPPKQDSAVLEPNHLPTSAVFYKLLEPGSDFQGYRIIRIMNKETEGIKYIAQKDDKQYVLKIFFKSSMNNMDSLFGLQMRLVKLNHLKDKHTAKVVEVNPHHDPAYMAAEYIHGVSLAHIKQHNPEKLSEEFIRHIAPQLIRTAIVIRKHDLTLTNLTLTGIMIDDKDDAIILSSGITFEDRDERDDLFVVGAILAQALSHNALYKTIYSTDRVNAQKFVYISGVSHAMNRVLGECLHRNILQRYLSLEDLLHAINTLPPLEEDEIWTVQEKTNLAQMEAINSAEKPKTRIEFGFWLIVILIVTLLAVLFTTNIFSVLFGGKGDTLQYIGIINRDDSRDTLNGDPAKYIDRSGSPLRTAYGDLKTGTGTNKPDFRRNIPERTANNVIATPQVSKPKHPVNMIYIEASTLGFGRLKENLQHNVSISPFYISPKEVTQAEWNRFMKPANCSTFGDNLPVDNVSWFDIAIYCNGRSEVESLVPAYKIRGVGASRVVTCDFKANGYRLPTEAEWELAAKAGQLFNYSGSEDPDETSWYRENGGGKIHTPATKSPNKWGLYDMTGNVAEWCWDWYDANYVRSLPTFINPNGPDTGTLKIIRGGSINNGEGRNLNILWREKGDPNRGYQYIGFRLVRSN